MIARETAERRSALAVHIDVRIAGADAQPQPGQPRAAIGHDVQRFRTGAARPGRAGDVVAAIADGQAAPRIRVADVDPADDAVGLALDARGIRAVAVVAAAGEALEPHAQPVGRGAEPLHHGGARPAQILDHRGADRSVDLPRCEVERAPRAGAVEIEHGVVQRAAQARRLDRRSDRALVGGRRDVGEIDVVARQVQRHRIGRIAQRRRQEGEVRRHPLEPVRGTAANHPAGGFYQRVIARDRIIAGTGQHLDRAAVDHDLPRRAQQVGGTVGVHLDREHRSRLKRRRARGQQPDAVARGQRPAAADDDVAEPPGAAQQPAGGRDRGSAQRAVDAQLPRIDGRGSGEGRGIGRQRQDAGPLLAQLPLTGDRAAIADIVRPVEGQRAAADQDVAGQRPAGAARADLQRARQDARAARIIVRAGQDQRAEVLLGKAARAGEAGRDGRDGRSTARGAVADAHVDRARQRQRVAFDAIAVGRELDAGRRHRARGIVDRDDPGRAVEHGEASAPGFARSAVGVGPVAAASGAPHAVAARDGAVARGLRPVPELNGRKATAVVDDQIDLTGDRGLDRARDAGAQRIDVEPVVGQRAAIGEDPIEAGAEAGIRGDREGAVERQVAEHLEQGRSAFASQCRRDGRTRAEFKRLQRQRLAGQAGERAVDDRIPRQQAGTAQRCAGFDEDVARQIAVDQQAAAAHGDTAAERAGAAIGQRPGAGLDERAVTRQRAGIAGAEPRSAEGERGAVDVGGANTRQTADLLIEAGDDIEDTGAFEDDLGIRRHRVRCAAAERAVPDDGVAAVGRARSAQRQAAGGTGRIDDQLARAGDRRGGEGHHLIRPVDDQPAVVGDLAADAARRAAIAPAQRGARVDRAALGGGDEGCGHGPVAGLEIIALEIGHAGQHRRTRAVQIDAIGARPGRRRAANLAGHRRTGVEIEIVRPAEEIDGIIGAAAGEGGRAASFEPHRRAGRRLDGIAGRRGDRTAVDDLARIQIDARRALDHPAAFVEQRQRRARRGVDGPIARGDPPRIDERHRARRCRGDDADRGRRPGRGERSAGVDPQRATRDPRAAGMVVRAREDQRAEVLLDQAAAAGDVGCDRRGGRCASRRAVTDTHIGRTGQRQRIALDTIAIADELEARGRNRTGGVIDRDRSGRTGEHREAAAPGFGRCAVEVGPVGPSVNAPHAVAARDGAVARHLRSIPELDIRKRRTGGHDQIDLTGGHGLQRAARAAAERPDVEPVIGQRPAIGEDPVEARPEIGRRRHGQRAVERQVAQHVEQHRRAFASQRRRDGRTGAELERLQCQRLP